MTRPGVGLSRHSGPLPNSTSTHRIIITTIMFFNSEVGTNDRASAVLCSIRLDLANAPSIPNQIRLRSKQHAGSAWTRHADTQASRTAMIGRRLRSLDRRVRWPYDAAAGCTHARAPVLGVQRQCPDGYGSRGNRLPAWRIPAPACIAA